MGYRGGESAGLDDIAVAVDVAEDRAITLKFAARRIESFELEPEKARFFELGICVHLPPMDVKAQAGFGSIGSSRPGIRRWHEGCLSLWTRHRTGERLQSDRNLHTALRETWKEKIHGAEFCAGKNSIALPVQPPLAASFRTSPSSIDLPISRR